MSVDIRMPNITAKDEAGQLLQIRSYLYQFAEQLQWALNTMESGGSDAVLMQNVNDVVERIAESKAQETFNRLKDSIIKSSDVVKLYIEEIEKIISGKYVAQSDFDSFTKEMNERIRKQEDIIRSGEVYSLGKLPPIPENTNLNEWRTIGCYVITQDAIAETISNLPPYITPRAGIIRVYYLTGSGDSDTGLEELAQEYTPSNGSGCYWRRLYKDGSDAEWEADEWIAVGGVDSVIESGSITTSSGIVWQYKKWFDGTAECWARRSVDVDATTPWGSGGSMYSGTISDTDLPLTFASPPVCHMCVENGTSPSSSAFFVASSGQATTTTAPSILLCQPTSAEGINVNVLYSVHGRWK